MVQLFPDSVYHIFNHANGNENLFQEEKNYLYFLEKYKKHVYPVATTYAYCLLPNHFHFLVKIRNAERLLKTFPKFGTLEKLDQQSNFISKQFGNLFSAYTQGYNKEYERMGSLFVKNFKRNLIHSNVQFQNTFLYINLNAVKHGFVRNEYDWKWSSLHGYNHGTGKTLLAVEDGISLFGGIDNLRFALKERRELLLNMTEE